MGIPAHRGRLRAIPAHVAARPPEVDRMMHGNRTLLLMTLLIVPALVRGEGQQEPGERGWSFSQRFQGSSNAAGVVLKTSSTAEYSFNRHVRAYTGIPIYIARETAASGSGSGTKFMNGIG